MRENINETIDIDGVRAVALGQHLPSAEPLGLGKKASVKHALLDADVTQDLIEDDRAGSLVRGRRGTVERSRRSRPQAR
jgi:hypothetical protein